MSNDPRRLGDIDEDCPGRQPNELVNLGNDCWVGIVEDNGCFVALKPKIDPPEPYDPDRSNKWSPLAWVPPKLAVRMGELAANRYTEDSIA